MGSLEEATPFTEKEEKGKVHLFSDIIHLSNLIDKVLLDIFYMIYRINFKSTTEMRDIMHHTVHINGNPPCHKLSFCYLDH